MKLISFNYTKLNVEKIGELSKDLKIETSINIEGIEEIKSESANTEKFFLNVKFNYIINYNPNIAKIELAGKMTILSDSKIGKEIVKNWENKKLDDKYRITIFNGILRKANIKAMQLEDEFNLPIHFKLPSLNLPKKE